MDRITSLVSKIATLPGLGPKSARRIVNKLLTADEAFNAELASEIGTLKSKVHPCKECGMWTEDELCHICSSPTRDKTILCIVEQNDDAVAIEESKVFNGLYHVLGGVIAPIDNIYPENLSFTELLARLENGTFKEIVIATNPTDEGDTTAIYTRSLILKAFPFIKVTRLSQGLQSGGDLEFANVRAICQSFLNRQNFI